MRVRSSKCRSCVHDLHTSTTFSNPFNSKRFLDYERKEVKRAKKEKRKLHDININESQLSPKHAKKIKMNPLSTKQHIRPSSPSAITKHKLPSNLHKTSSPKNPLKCSLFSPNISITSQSKSCDDIWRETVKAKQTKTKLHDKLEAFMRYKKETKFERKRRKSITAMVNETETDRKCMKDRGKIVIKSTLKQFTEQRWRINVKQLNIERDKRKNNVIVGVQIMNKKKTYTIYSNEKGEIFMNKKHIKRGCKIKTKSDMMISAEYQENRILVNFWYVIHGKMVQVESIPIVIEDIYGFEHDAVKMNVFVAQNENVKYGEYLISKLPQTE